MVRKIAAALVCCACVTSTAAQENQPNAAAFGVTRINDHIYLVEGRVGLTANFVVSVGADGVLLVDAGRSETAGLLRPFLDSLAGAPVRIVISTHPHDDHTGGNEAFGPEVCVMADSAAAGVITGGYFALPPLTDTRKIDRPIARDTSFIFNGEEVCLMRVPNAHTEGDLMVWFAGSKILCVGDLLFDKQIPFVDLTIGGNPRRFADVMKRLADTLAADVTVLPGHGRPSHIADLREMSEMLQFTTGRVRQALLDGETSETVLADPRLARWAAWSHTFETTKMSYWIPCLFQAFGAEGDESLPSICQPLTEAIMSQGIGAALERYRELKALPTPQYAVTENDLNMLGYHLMWRQMMPAAEGIFELAAAEYPESGNVYDSRGEYFLAVGDTARAIRDYETSLVKNPDNANAVAVLERLRGRR